MKTTTVTLTLRDLTYLLNSLRASAEVLTKKMGDEEEDAHTDLMMVDDLIARLKTEHTALVEAKKASRPPAQER